MGLSCLVLARLVLWVVRRDLTAGLLGVWGWKGIDGWEVAVGIAALWDLLSSGGLELSSARSLVCSRWWGGIIQLLD